MRKLERRDLLKTTAAVASFSIVSASRRAEAVGQSAASFPPGSAVWPQITREDLVHLYVGPWRGLRPVIEKRVIDFHCHLAIERASTGYVLSADELMESMDRYGIGKACLPKSKGSVRAKIPYSEDLRLVAKHPERLIQLASPDEYSFSDPKKAADQVRQKLAQGARAIGELTFTGDRERYLENVYPTLEVAESLDVAVLFGTRAGEYAERKPTYIARLAARFPNVKLIIGDAGGRGFAHGGGWEAIVMASTFPNLHIEVGGAPVEIIDAAVKHLGADKVLFGSNFTSLGPSLGRPIEHSDGAQHWRNLNAVALSNTSEAQKELILHKNAERLLKL